MISNKIVNAYQLAGNKQQENLVEYYVQAVKKSLNNNQDKPVNHAEKRETYCEVYRERFTANPLIQSDKTFENVRTALANDEDVKKMFNGCDFHYKLFKLGDEREIVFILDWTNLVEKSTPRPN